jgi:hypothetical protein
MHHCNEYNKIFILVCFINVIITFIIDYTNYIALLIYINSLSINFIMLKDIHFEIKNHYSHINFYIMYNFYPSYRNNFKILWCINSLCIFIGALFTCYNFWMIEFDDFTILNKSFNYIISLLIITIATNVLIIFSIIIIIYYLWNSMIMIFNIFRIITFNYYNYKPLLSSYKEAFNYEQKYICWICETSLNKVKTIKKLTCSCNESFHNECIDKYLQFHNNICRAGHKIPKYDHEL